MQMINYFDVGSLPLRFEMPYDPNVLLYKEKYRNEQ